MPKFDGTGPQGMGPMTGRGLGPCGGRIKLGGGRGFRCGLGRCFGWKSLSDYKKALEEELEEVKKQEKGLK